MAKKHAPRSVQGQIKRLRGGKKDGPGQGCLEEKTGLLMGQFGAKRIRNGNKKLLYSNLEPISPKRLFDNIKLKLLILSVFLKMDPNDRRYITPYFRMMQFTNDPPNVVNLINARQTGLERRSTETYFNQFAEFKACVSIMKPTHYHFSDPSRAVSLMAFSRDCSKVATAHGDYKIYVNNMITCACIWILEGHASQLVCIEFHPVSNEILASGGLDGEVIVWDLIVGSIKWRTKHQHSISSITLHPTKQLVVVATGNSLHCWDLNDTTSHASVSTHSEVETVKYVKFDPVGNRIITGILNVSVTSTATLNEESDESLHPGYPSPVSPSSQDSDGDGTGKTSIQANPDGINSSSDRAEGSGEANRSELSGVDNESRPSESGRSPPSTDSENATGQEPLTDISALMTEPFRKRLNTVFKEWVAEAFDPIFNTISESSSTESHKTVRTTHEDLDTVSCLSSTPAEGSQPELHSMQMFNLASMKSVGTSTGDLNTSLSDMSQSGANNNESFNNSEPSSVRNREHILKTLTPAELWHSYHMLEDTCARLRMQLSECLQRNYASSQNEEESGESHSEELVPGDDRDEVDYVRLQNQMRNVLSDIQLNMQACALSLAALEADRNEMLHEVKDYVSNIEFFPEGAFNDDAKKQLSEQENRLQQVDREFTVTISMSEESDFIQPGTSSDISSAAGASSIAAAPGAYNDSSTSGNSQTGTSSDISSAAGASSEAASSSGASSIAAAPGAYNDSSTSGNSQTGLNTSLNQDYRIQAWDFLSGELPPIYDEGANVVVGRCVIYNDDSVDISQDGEKLVVLLACVKENSSDKENTFDIMYGVFSLISKHLGRNLCMWSEISNGISVSFSPLARYVVVGCSSSTPEHLSPEIGIFAHIVKLSLIGDMYVASKVRSLTYAVNDDYQFSVNSIKWLPMSGFGIAFATNVGCLCIGMPMCGEFHEEAKDAGSAEIIDVSGN